MRIVGTGFDQTELERIRDAVARFGERFLKRCFTAEEQRFCFERRDPIPSLAARYAAKEAAAKALGTGLARGVAWTEIEVRRQRGERPTIHFSGRAKEHAERMGVAQAHVSLTHSRELAAAMVIVESE